MKNMLLFFPTLLDYTYTTTSLPLGFFPIHKKSQNTLPAVKPSALRHACHTATHQHHRIPCINSEAHGSAAEMQQDNLISNHSIVHRTF